MAAAVIGERDEGGGLFSWRTTWFLQVGTTPARRRKKQLGFEDAVAATANEGQKKALFFKNVEEVLLFSVSIFLFFFLFFVSLWLISSMSVLMLSWSFFLASFFFYFLFDQKLIAKKRKKNMLGMVRHNVNHF